MTLRTLRLTLLLLFLLAGIPLNTLAQEADTANTCLAAVDAAITAAAEGCGEIGRNQACYGNVLVDARLREGVTAIFEQVGDYLDVGELQTLYTAPFDPVTEVWGIAIMKLQANLPDTLPGQNVTFVLFGDVEMTNQVMSSETEARSATYTAPMQSFTFKTGIGPSEESCLVPPSAIVVQSPQDTQVTFEANGVEVVLGSTMVLQSATDSPWLGVVLEGAAEITSTDKTATVEQGAQAVVRLDKNDQPDSTPGVIPYTPEKFKALEQSQALHLLPETITLPDLATARNVVNVACDLLPPATAISASEPVILGSIIDAGPTASMDAIRAAHQFHITLDGVALEDYNDFAFLGVGDDHRAILEPGVEALVRPEVLPQFTQAWITYYPVGFLEPGNHTINTEVQILQDYDRGIVIDGQPSIRQAGTVTRSCTFTVEE